jgi:hypothetical protein
MRNLVNGTIVVSAAVLMLGFGIASARHVLSATTDVSHQVRTQLMSLPEYGVFDLITLSQNDGVVTLGGYVVTPALKHDAEQEARQMTGVTEVRDRIEIAPASPLDDEIRVRAYHVIYDESALSRYRSATSAPSMRPGPREWGAQPHGMFVRSFDGPPLSDAPFYGYEPIGICAIHILVKNGIVTLAGDVDDESDRKLVGRIARGVAGVRWVVNSLETTRRR